MNKKTEITPQQKLEKIQQFFEMLEEIPSDQDLMKMVESHISDDMIELFVDHIEDFYGIHEEEELGVLAQIMVTGYLLGKNETESIEFKS